MIDLRSDTVTVPDDAMRAAMASAEVGDDVLGEDPTINALEREAAELFGKEAALFVPSGTMGNQVSLGTLTQPGQEVLADAQAHILINEVGSVSRLWGCQITPLPSERGWPTPETVAAAVRTPDIHHPVTSVLSLENTHNYAGGTVLPLEQLDALVAVAREHELAIHMDGARLFNAQVASGIPVSRWVRDVDLTSVCLSKGLGAPVGSIVVGHEDHVVLARRLRKALGGGMRQAGVLAAAARLALAEGPGRMEDDHRRARELAERLQDVPGLSCDLDAVQTNIVFVDTEGPAGDAEDALGAAGLLCFALSEHRLRFVFHRDVGDEAVEGAHRICRQVFAG